MLKRLSGFFSNDLAIDLGTANTLIYVRNKGIILDEPSVVAIKSPTIGGGGKTVLAIGQDAKRMLGRTPGFIQAIRPLKDGVIADFNVTEDMLKYFVRKAQETKLFASPRIIICVPCGSTQVERRAIRESATSAGAREVYLIEEPMAVAIGANLPVAEPTGSMVVDVGGGTTEVGIVSLGGMVYSNSLRVAGDSFDESIVNYVRRRHGLLIGDVTAERIKQTIATAWSESEHMEMEIKGRDISEGLSRSLVITSEEIYESINDSLEQIVRVIREALEKTPPELIADIGEKGMVVAGGGALLRDIDRRFMQDTGLPVIIAEQPLTCVVRGCGRALEEMDAIGDVFTGDG
ncbi:rod shape-determining protein [Candidatus Spongiihabitans sp.]|uniref:rod shape-determining protein n=1 Tax=Candidatus Spongiihabitans sp. TaxID=3101308 RepID=UPI003C7000F3